jgi:tetratricopeptide (TPR) repeat protein
MSNSMTGVGWLCLGRGEYAKAVEWFEKITAHLERAGAEKDLLVLRVASWLISAYIELGETEKAENQIDILRKLALETEDEQLIVTLNTLKAMLLRAQKKWDESLKLFEKNLQEWEALDARKWYVCVFAKMVLCEYARAYLERDKEGDREKAHSLLNQALEIFQKTGAKKDIEKVIAKKKLLTA